MSSDKTNSFCYKYLSQVSGIQPKTVEVMVDNGFDSIHTLLAVKVDIDLDLISGILLGQKLVLREALRELHKQYQQMVSEAKEDDVLIRWRIEESLLKTKKSSFETPIMRYSSLKTRPVIELTPIKMDIKVDPLDIIKSKARIETKSSTKTGVSQRVKKLKTPKICQVCGGQANGNNYGVLSCHGCGIFFSRVIKKRIIIKECVNSDDNCDINPMVKKWCHSCRYQACLRAGMAYGSHIKNEEKSAEESGDHVIEKEESDGEEDMEPLKSPLATNKKVCKVCGVSCKGTNFRVLSCNGCGVFFSKVVNNKTVVNECVNSDNNCEVNPFTRNNCRFCRYQACLRAGMALKGDKSKVHEEDERVDDSEQESNGETVLPDIGSDMSGNGLDYAFINCGRSPESPTKRSKRIKITNKKYE